MQKGYILMFMFIFMMPLNMTAKSAKEAFNVKKWRKRAKKNNALKSTVKNTANLSSNIANNTSSELNTAAGGLNTGEGVVASSFTDGYSATQNTANSGFDMSADATHSSGSGISGGSNTALASTQNLNTANMGMN